MTDAVATNAATEALRPHRSLWYDVWAQFRTHRGALAGAAVFGLIVLAVAVAETSMGSAGSWPVNRIIQP